jgi:hypothetical protein
MVSNNRVKIKEKVRYLLWAKSAGRCQFDGCNKPLYQDGHTQIQMNFGQVAHIIGQGEKGPRSYAEIKLDKKYVNDIGNLMLMCPTHHKLIDDNPGMYDDELLREMKFSHEIKVWLATEMKVDNTSNVIIYRGRIGSFQPTIEFKEVMRAMFPDYYPADRYPHELGMSGSLLEDHSEEFWKREVENLEIQFSRQVSRLLGNDKERNHYSIFAFAPIPLLIKLGSLLPNKYPAQVYQLKKEPACWQWESEIPEGFEFMISEPKEDHELIALNLSLSADVDNHRIFDALESQDVSIWKISVPETEFPKDDHLRSKEQLISFSRNFSKLLNKIKRRHGQNSKLSIFPAIGVAYAVEIGRLCSEKSDMQLSVFDQNNRTGGFIHALDVNERKIE